MKTIIGLKIQGGGEVELTRESVNFLTDSDAK